MRQPCCPFQIFLDGTVTCDDASAFAQEGFGATSPLPWSFGAKLSTKRTPAGKGEGSRNWTVGRIGAPHLAGSSELSRGANCQQHFNSIVRTLHVEHEAMGFRLRKNRLAGVPHHRPQDSP